MGVVREFWFGQFWNASSLAGLGRGSDMNEDIQTLARTNEDKYGLPRNLLVNLVRLESGGDPDAYNKTTEASGLTQIIPKYHPSVKNPFDPFESLDYTARTLRGYADQFGSYEAAVAAWHAGPARVQENIASGGNGIPKTKDRVTGLSTQDYVARIVSGLDTVLPGDALTVTYNEFNRQKLLILAILVIGVGAFVIASKG